MLSEQLRIESDGIFLKDQMIRDVKGTIQRFETAENGNKMIMASEETNGNEHYIRFSHYESPNQHAECEIVPLSTKEDIKDISLKISQEGREAVITTANGKQMWRWWR